jgi:ABC-type sugar transport system ATPase subunit
MNLVAGKLGDGVIHLPGGQRYRVPAAARDAVAGTVGRDGDVILGFRPEAAEIDEKSGDLVGEVYASDMHGAYRVLHVTLDGGEPVHIRSDRMAHYPIGSTVRFDLNHTMARFFDPKSERAIRPEGAQA